MEVVRLTVPGNDADGDAQGDVSRENAAIGVVVDNLFGERQVGHSLEVLDGLADLELCERKLCDAWIVNTTHSGLITLPRQ